LNTDRPDTARGAHAWALLAYALVALVFSWPLPRNLAGALTGPITGDTGVYVWNIWLFRHEIVDHGRFPLFTGEILSLLPPVDLGFHNYTLFADLLAFPLIPALGLLATFNVVYLALTTLTAWSMFVLARAITGRDAEAWLAGLLFGFSPVLVARSTAHFSLVAAAPLPLFLLALRRAERDGSIGFAAAAGAAAAWAAMCDAYYGIFCVLIAACYLTARYVEVRRASMEQPPAGRARLVVDISIVIGIAVIATVAVSGGGEWRVLGGTLALRTLYTPVLVLTILVATAVWLRVRPQFIVQRGDLRGALRLGAAGAGAFTLGLAPVLVAVGYGLADGSRLHGPIFWRTSPPGVDLAAFFMPNPNHAWLGGPSRAWLTRQPNGYVENVASLTIVACAIVAIALWRYRFRPARVWVAMTVFFGSLALGPFIHIGGLNTYIPGPWALARYFPIVTATRTPARYAVPLMMAFAILFALALRHITSAHPHRRRVIVLAAGAALLVELAPFPRTLYSARIPDVYRTIANDPRDVRILELPFGFRDGERSQGGFTAATQFYQTFHQKRLIGGYLSRISDRQLQRQRESVTVRRLIRLSEGESLSDAELEDVKQRAPGFVDRARIGYVVVDVARTPAQLRSFAIDAYGLVKIGESDGRELYVPTVGTFSAEAR